MVVRKAKPYYSRLASEPTDEHGGHASLHTIGHHQWYHFGVGAPPTHFRTYFSGDRDVHRGYDLAFDPWPHIYIYVYIHICIYTHIRVLESLDISLTSFQPPLCQSKRHTPGGTGARLRRRAKSLGAKSLGGGNLLGGFLFGGQTT